MFLPPFLTGLFFSVKLPWNVWMLLPVGFFWLIAGILWWQILDRSQQFGVTPDTVVTGSVSFSPRKKKLFEPERRSFEFRNDAFGNAFAELNRAKLWDPYSPQAIAAKSNRAILQYIGIGLLIVFAIYSLLYGGWEE